MLIPFATDFAGGPQERATTNHQLACFRLRGLARDFQAANPRPARVDDASLRPAGRTEETATY